MLAIIFVICIIGCSGLATPAAGADLPPVLPEVAATHQVTLYILEGDGSPTEARVSVFDPATGEPFWPVDPSIPTYEAYTGHNFFYATNPVQVRVNEGWVRVVGTRGPEYSVSDQTFYVGRSISRLVSFMRLFDPAALGWYSGDTHVHVAHGGEGAVYTITNEDLARVARAEELNVTCALSNGLYFNGGLDPAGDVRHLIHFGVEYRSALYGHMGVIGLPTILSSFACCLPDYPAIPLNLEIQAEAHELGAVVSYAHPVSVDPSFMSDTRLDWPYSGLARELPVDLLIGEVDVYDLFAYSNYDRDVARDLWFDLLDLGRRLPLSVGTDTGLNRYFDPPAGGYRVYVHTPGGLDFGDWLEGLRAGHSFATNGPLLYFTLDGIGPGDTLSLPATGDDPLQVHMRLQSRTPAARLDIYASGELVHTRPLPSYSGELELTFPLDPPNKSGWMVARVTGPLGGPADVGEVLEAVTSPVFVRRGDADMVPRNIAAHRFMAWIEELQDIVLAREGWETPRQRISVWNVLETARLILVGPNTGQRPGPALEHFEQLDRGTVSLTLGEDARLFRAEGRGEGMLEVFDVQGRRVYASAPRTLPAEFPWRAEVEGSGLAAGLYFGRVRTDGAVSRTYRLRLVR